jgi:hypothetical protein
VTIDRMLRRGRFPILSERPLDESETTNAPEAKVYVVEVGAYSDRYIDAIFTTRELAEAFVADRQRRAFQRDGIKAHREVTSWAWTELRGTGPISFEAGVATMGDGRTVDGEPQYREVPAETFEEFLRRHTWNEFGDVEEYDIWDVLPVVPDS